MSPSEPSPPRYEVVSSPVIVQRLRTFYRRAQAAGQGELMADALRGLQERLAESPEEFGEPLFHSHDRSTEVRLGFVPPIAALVGVVAEEKQVFIGQVSILSRYQF